MSLGVIMAAGIRVMTLGEGGLTLAGPTLPGHLNVQWRINRDKNSDKTFHYTTPAADASGCISES